MHHRLAVRAGLLVVGVLLLAASAKLNLPLPYVPMTLQTLVVLVIGAIYGWPLGVATVVAYLAIGALGLPVFAGPVGGPKPLFGPTAGFLFGFAAATLIVGALSARGWDRSFARMIVAMAIGHVVILAAGFAWLAYGIGLGPAKAWSVGILPFLAGAVVKTVLGAILVPRLRHLADLRRTDRHPLQLVR
ncbi:MAG: biotin transporter BioY [Tardiphaga sp.]